MVGQPSEREFEQRRSSFPTIFMVLGIMFLAYSAYIFAFGVGLETIIRYSNGSNSGFAPSELTSLLRLLAQPAILIGLGLFLIGLVNRTKNHVLHKLRNIVTILGMSLISFAILVALFMIIAKLIGSILFT